jgi:hypothetical protein
MIKGIRREMDARRQSKATESSIKAHKDTMLGLLRASVKVNSDSPEQSQRRRYAAGDPEAVYTSSTGEKRSPSKERQTPRDSGGHVEVKK